MLEGCWAIADSIMEKKMKVQGPGHPWWSRRATQSLAAVYNINEWKWGLDEGVSYREVRKTDNIHAHRYKWGIAHSCHVGGGSRRCRWQGMPRVPRCSSGGSPSLWGGSSDGGSNQGSLHSTMMRVSSGSNRLAHTGRSLWVKVNLPIFKDEKSKDAVTYHPWWWDVAIFHWSGWDIQHLLSYIFNSLQRSWVT